MLDEHRHPDLPEDPGSDRGRGQTSVEHERGQTSVEHELGQTSVEYVGAILVVSVLIAAFVGAVPDVAHQLVDAIRHQIDTILGG